MEPSLAPHISQLLFEHDCVIVPGFGGFVADYQSAVIHPTQHTFSPPSKRIAFNINLKNNDGLLANQLVQAKNYSYSEANKDIVSEVEVWNKELETTKKLKIEKVGTLRVDVEKNLHFEADAKINFLLDSFGLTEIQSPPIKREGIREQLKPAVKNWKPKEFETKRSWLDSNKWRLAAAVLVLAVSGEIIWLALKPGNTNSNPINFAYLNPFSDSSIFNKKTAEQVKTVTEPIVSAPEKETIPNTESSSAAENTTINTTSENTENASGEKTDNPSENSRSETVSEKTNTAIESKESSGSSVESGITSDKKFLVVGGCFAVPENADKFMNTLKSKGYPAAIAGKTNKGLIMVIYDAFDRRSEAVPLLHKIKSQEDSTAWIFKN